MPQYAWADWTPPSPVWEPLGAAITQAKVEAAGVTTGQVEGTDMNICFPSVFQNPSWWAAGAGLGSWLMTFTSHRGDGVLLAHTNTPFVAASWTVVGTRVLTYQTLVNLCADVAYNTAISPAWAPPDEHLSSPDVFVDDANQRFLVMVHAGANARPNMGAHVSYGLYTTNLLSQAAYTIHGPVGAAKTLEYQEYARWVPKVGQQHGTHVPLVITGDGDMKMCLGAAADWYDQTTSAGWNNTIDATGFDGVVGPAQRQRHCCAYRLATDRLKVYWTVNGGDPEHIQSMEVNVPDPAAPSTWRAVEGTRVDERFPLLDWEGFGMGGRPSVGSAALNPEEQLRDPQVINIGSDRAMFCSVRGEYGIGVYKLAGAAVSV